ncbi:GNAT family N-acetyltransferase [Dyella sp.]|uniref:GNAT family N-acetyltransferase n=1 Tax=Dyella sp. TaxID=1869338 RepID=UPI002ED5BFAE
MELQDFHVQSASWATPSDREALKELRLEILGYAQSAPETQAWDDLDDRSVHVLARDAHGRPVGCGRMTQAHTIGCMAVRGDWRDKGVERALLRELVARARSLGWPEVTVDAPLQANDMHAREGFVAEGDVFALAGIPLRRMRMVLWAKDPHPAASEQKWLPAATREALATSRLTLLRDSRHRLMIYQPLLPVDIYTHAAEMDELRRIATSGRGAQIRVLLHDPQSALRDNHRLVALAQRLSSTISIRVPSEETDLAYTSAYLLNDVGGYLFLPEASRPQGRAASLDRAGQAPLGQHFDDVWDRAEPATALLPLGI